MGDDGGYGDSSGGNGGGNWGSNNNYADNYNNYSYGNDTNDFSNKYSSYNDSKEDKYSAYTDSNKNEESRVHSMVKQFEDSTPKSYESSKPFDETPKYDDTRANFAETPRSEQISTSTPTQENNTTNPTSDVAASSPVVSSESHSSHKKPEESKKEEKDDNNFGDDDDDDDDDDLKFKRDPPNENITVTTAEINTPPGATCDHKTLAVLLGSVTAGHMSSESAHEAAELEALESLHDACKCNGSSRIAADDINLDDTRENTDLLNDSSETQPLEDGKKPEAGDEDDCLLSVLTFCVTCCECVIS